MDYAYERDSKQFKMPNYNVTLNFSVRVHSPSEIYMADEDEMEAMEKAFERTDEFYETHNIQTYIKTFDAMGLVEYVCCEGEVVSAEWDPEHFQIHMVVKTEETAKELKQDLRMNSLEDGEYEGCGESGWIIMTRDPEGKVYDGSWDRIKEFWEYALLDYRDNPIKVTLIEEPASAVPASAAPEAIVA